MFWCSDAVSVRLFFFFFSFPRARVALGRHLEDDALLVRDLFLCVSPRIEVSHFSVGVGEPLFMRQRRSSTRSMSVRTFFLSFFSFLWRLAVKQKIFCVFDDKAKAYLPPFFMPEVLMAVRTFRNCAQDKEHAFGRNPEDYSLFFLGTFDHDSAAFEIFAAASCVARGIEAAARGDSSVKLEAVS